MKAEVERLWNENKCLIHDARPRATVEPSPKMAPYVNAGGKILSKLEDAGEPKVSIRPEWGPPLKIYDNRNVEDPICVAEYHVASGWDIRDTPLRNLAPRINIDELKRHLRQ